MDRQGFVLPHSFLILTENLGAAERGRLITACLTYSMTGLEPELSGNERLVWPWMKDWIDKNNEKYLETCEKNRKNASSRYATNTDQEPLPTKSAKKKINSNCLDEDDPLSPRARLDELERHWKDMLGRKPSPVQSTEIAGWLDTWDYELLKEAIKAAGEANAGNPVSYVRATMTDWKSRGINTIEKWGEAEAKRDGMI